MEVMPSSLFFSFLFPPWVETNGWPTGGLHRGPTQGAYGGLWGPMGAYGGLRGAYAGPTRGLRSSNLTPLTAFSRYLST